MVGVIATGGQQYIVAVGKTIEIDKIKKIKPGGFVEFDDILNKGNVVIAKLISGIKGKKINILKFKNKTRYLRRYGHRQNYSIIEIVDIKTKAKKTKSTENGKNSKSI